MRSRSRFLFIVTGSIILVLILATGSGCSMLLVGAWLDPTTSAADSDSPPADEPPAPPAGSPPSGTQQIIAHDEQVTLAWDPPASPVTSYKVYYRIHETGSWTLLEEIPAVAAPEYTIQHSSFDDGEYDFGVVAVDGGTGESPMHTSLDPTAYPTSGWYLEWIV
jgi:hypothetical protein